MGVSFISPSYLPCLENPLQNLSLHNILINHNYINLRVGRVFLQPDKNDRKPGKFNKDRVFTEGWIEFKSKKIAKYVAETLNSNPVGGKRRSKAHDELWNIKYLPR